MQDLKIVKCSQTTNDLNDDLPNMLLLHELLIILTLTDALEDVSIVGELHYDAKVDTSGQEELNDGQLTRGSSMARRRMPVCRRRQRCCGWMPKYAPRLRRFLSLCLTSSES
jgi:hypothetical protein